MNIQSISTKSTGIAASLAVVLMTITVGLFTSAVFYGLPDGFGRLKPMVNFGSNSTKITTYFAIGISMSGFLGTAGIHLYRYDSNVRTKPPNESSIVELTVSISDVFANPKIPDRILNNYTAVFNPLLWMILKMQIFIW